jgi:hypothetical protein
MSWKNALYDYVHAKNRAEAEQDAELLHTVVSDAAILREYAHMLDRSKRSSAERGLKTLEQETKLRLIAARETGSSVAADVALHRTIRYELRGQRYEEERVERERVLLTPGAKQNRWTVSRVDRTHPPDGKTGPTQGMLYNMALGRPWEPEPEPVVGSVPYLNTSILNPQESSSRRAIYNRAAAVQYAETWWNGRNPRYIEFEVDCTNFVSQCLFAGGLPMDYTGKRESGWWYRGKSGGRELWSYSWAVANSLPRYLLGSGRATQVGSPAYLIEGDVICYDWDGDGRWQHNVIITARDITGMPLVNAHTYNARSRHWAYHDSPAWSGRTAYLFLRMADRI